MPRTIGKRASIATVLLMAVTLLPAPAPPAAAVLPPGEPPWDAVVGDCAVLSDPVPDVTISNFIFTPDDITVAETTMVRWTNNGSSQHTTTSDDTDPKSGQPLWDSGALPVDGEWVVLFCDAGDYAYHCEIHTFMEGVVRVTAL